MDGKYTQYKKWFIGLSAVMTLFFSIWFSKRGFGFGGDGANDWVGWVLAFAATSAEMMVQSDRRKLTLTTFFIGLPAYGYSIWTNIAGFHEIRGAPVTESIYTVLSVCGGIFMDLFPETALMWVFEEAKLGDIFGSIVYYWKHPDELIGGQKKPNNPERRF